MFRCFKNDNESQWLVPSVFEHILHRLLIISSIYNSPLKHTRVVVVNGELADRSLLCVQQFRIDRKLTLTNWIEISRAVDWPTGSGRGGGARRLYRTIWRASLSSRRRRHCYVSICLFIGADC